MNEKELREAWNESPFYPMSMEGGIHRNEMSGNLIFEWFIARIQERDERLKEEINAMKQKCGYRKDPCVGDGCEEGRVNGIIDDIISIIDNHD